MRSTITIGVILLITAIGQSSANTLTEKDARDVLGLSEQANQITHDLLEIEKGRQTTQPNNAGLVFTMCSAQIQGVITAVAITLNGTATTFFLSSKMKDAHDEDQTISAAKAEVRDALTTTAAARSVLNVMLGACAKDAVLVAKSQQITSFLNQTDTTIREIGSRLSGP